MKLSEQRRRCRYVHLERERDSLNSSTVLLISGDRDSYVTLEIATRLQSIVGRHCQLWIAPGAKHNMSCSTCAEEYDRRVVAHFHSCLRPEMDMDSNCVDDNDVASMRLEISL